MTEEVKLITVNQGTSAQWSASDARPLEPGEFGYVTDTDKLKIGNGTDSFDARPTLITDEDIVNTLSGNQTDKAPSVAAVKVNLDAKVDKDGDKGLSDANFTTAEKEKLAGLESSKFRGLFSSLSALQAVTGEAGAYADVDMGAGEDVTRFVWDVTDSKWVDQKGVTTAETTASVKQKYEANPDTNVFSDDEKSKLAGIATGAQVNPGDATTTTAGLMSSTDKSNLDSLVAKHGYRVSGGNPTMRLVDYETVNAL